MKLRFLARWLAVAALFLSAASAHAYDFSFDGIYYDVLSEEDRTVEVTRSESSGSYSGSIIIPERVLHEGKTYTVTSIGDYAFYNCYVLTSVVFPVSLMSIGDYAFYNCSALTSVDLSSTSLTSIGYATFYNCDALTSVAFPASLMSIGYYAFSGCEALTNLTVDESNPAFASRDNVLYSKSLDTLVCYPAGLGKEVVIPESVRSVREDAFPGEVSTVYCQPQTPPTAVYGYFQNMFSSDELMNAVLYVPVGTKAAYMKVDPWRNFWNIEEMDFATVGIDGVAAQGVPSVTVRGGAIVVEGAAATDVVEVFAADGRCAYRGASATISHLPGGIYVVRVGKHVQKVAL